MLTHADFEQRCEALTGRLQTLPDKPQETVAATLKVLWLLAAGRALSVDAAQEIGDMPTLDTDAAGRLDALIAQRLSGVPLSHLSGRQRFMGLEMLSGPQALIPRRETELLGYAAGELLQACTTTNPLVVDVCTGSGNLALALAALAPRAEVHASDLSSDAVELARRNALHLGLGDRVDWRVGDLLEPFDQTQFHGRVDLLVCNPPYISSQRVDTMPAEISGFEPRLAFDGGALGVRIVQRLVQDAPRFLRSGGWLAFEVGAGQGASVLKRLQRQAAFVQHKCLTDAHGEIRSILAGT